METKELIFKPIWIYATAFLLIAFSSCNQAPQQEEAEETDVTQVEHPIWTRSANIYEVNVRQYTPEGTLDAFSEHVNRLSEMGVDILWFMPITPIGEENRKGSLGSYYAIKDYTAINPEFGTMDDFKLLVRQIHEQGMYVILDWVANHTAWDHPWTETNPEFYTTDEEGNFVPPVEDWSDVIDLNYDNRELWDAMIGEMRFWVEEVGVDGFRCDVADMVPLEFWETAREELSEIRPIFMLAEAETPELQLKAFNMGYGWELHHIMNRIGKGEATAADLDNYFFEENAGDFPEGTMRMNFLTNHDENSWAGTVFDRYGEGVEAFAVLTATAPGMMLIYSGQEAGLDKQLEFFEKDTIDWGPIIYHEFYSTLIGLKKMNSALWNGPWGGPIKRVNTSNNEQIFAFTRENFPSKVFTVLNLSDQPAKTTFEGGNFTGTYNTLFTNEPIEINEDFSLELEPWEYLIFEYHPE